jgi:hypothetical protein
MSEVTVTITNTDVNLTETYTTLSLGNAGPQGIPGDTGPTGPSGVIAVTAPITNTGTSTSANIGVDQTALVIAKTQVSGTAVVVADLASASVNFANTSGTATFATNAGTASYSVTSGTAVYGINAGTAVYATNAGTAVYATNAGTAVYANTAGTAAPSAHASTHASGGSDAVTLAQSQVTNLETDLAAKTTNSILVSATHQLSDAADSVNRGGLLNVYSPGSGVFVLTAFTALTSFTTTQVTTTSGALSTGLTVARMGLYTVDSSNLATLVAETANDTSLFAAASTLYTRSFDTARGLPATYNIVAGQRYAFGIIVVGTGVGSFWGIFQNATMAMIRGLSPSNGRSVTGRSDLAATESMTGSNIMTWGRFS